MAMNNSLAEVHPELVSEWSEKNLPLTPDDITFGSNKKVWWRGACGHEWQTSVKARSNGEKCPICSGARVIAGINDLAILEPLLVKQWSKKNKIKPTEVSIGSHPNRIIYRIGDFICNIIRSIPFLILLILLIPFTRLIVGKSYGSTATIVPLVICAAPYIARVVESSLNEVDAGVIEAAKAMGASNMQIIFKVLLVEARTSLINGATITTGLLLGYSAMSGTVGGGGLGDIAVRYGYYRWQTDIMIVTVVLLIVIFQIIQNLGTRLSGRLDHRKR